jgi:hypothetical protein
MLHYRLILVLAIAAGAVVGCDRPAARESVDGVTPSAGAGWFSELPAGRAVDFHRDAGPEEGYFMPEIMGSGAAFLDYDGDGLLDLFLVGGRWSQGGDRARMQNRLYRQQPDGSFTEVSAAAGLLESRGYGVGIAVGDLDNDGDLDVYVTGFGGDRLWVNQGDGTFADETHSLETINERWGTAAAFFDYDRDGWLDLCVVNYLDYYPGSLCDDGSGRRDYCGPTSFQGTVSRLYRNLGESGGGLRFTDVTVAAGLTAVPGPGLGLLCRDFDGDGRPDMLVANDMSPNTLWMQQADGTFRDEAMLRGVAVNCFGQAEANMGVVCADLDGDGLDDVFITTLRGETSALYLGRPEGQFQDGIAGSGLGPPSLEMTGFGAVSFDLENDGDLDLIVVNGRVKRAPPLKAARSGAFWNDYAEPKQIFVNEGGGHFVDASRAGDLLTQRLDVSRALAYGDLDNDGDFDLVVTSCAGPVRIYQNDVPRKGNWLMVRAVDPALNRDAIGARVEIAAADRRWHREINPSSSYLSSNDFRVHFGLGETRSYDRLIVHWPDGLVEHFSGGATDRHIVVYRGRGSAPPEPGP